MKQLFTLTAICLTVFSSFSQNKEQDSLIIQLAFQKQDSSKVLTSIELIKLLYNAEDYQKALQYVQQSEDLSETLQFNRGTAEIKYYKALIYTQREDYYNALDNYNKSLSIYSQLSDSLGIAKVNNSLGLVEIRRGNYTKGLRHSLSAIGIFENNNLRNELSLAYNNLAEAYFNTSQFDKSLEYNLKALDVREILNDINGLKITNKNIAKLYAIKGEHRRAIEFYEKVILLLDPDIDRELRGEILPDLGEQYLLFRQFDKAAPYLLEGLRYNRRIDNKRGLLKSLNNLAQLNLIQRNVRTAENQLDEAYAITLEISDDTELLKHFELRKTLDSTKGNFRSAFNWQSRYFDLKAKMEEENKSSIAIDEPIEEEPVLTNPVTTDSALTEQLTKKNQNLWYYIYGLAALLAAALIYLVVTLMKRKDINSQMEFLQHKNRQYKLQNDDILSQTAHLEEMNHVKDRLFSIVSHDLKDSITSIKAFLDLLKENSISEREFNELIPELSENADNASALLLNLLNWSKSQLQNLEPKPETFNIQDIFQEKIQLVDKKVKKKRIVLLDESVKSDVYADKSMVEIVIQNLLANAIKFSRVGDVITISNRDRNGNSLICIEDTGVGISKENQAKLFGAGGFTTRGTSDEKGTGLGLSICKQLVELNHGTIWVESEVGFGSKFFVELPKSNPDN
ncbi:MAG: tetratricopeptide repeat protein [Bacteroidia bacterium]|nr:tetratricopeptide repeat protein [Bacteroidia bacterium]NNL32583.1 tetratricopeptide repeat protein [Flavobacteriaceae bacterium]